jgi:hypothetical protein
LDLLAGQLPGFRKVLGSPTMMAERKGPDVFEGAPGPE